MLVELINNDFYYTLSCLDKLDEYGYELVLLNDHDFSGYFCEEEKKLTVVLNENWFQTFVHEYCHFEQFINQTTIWKDSKIDGVGCDDILEKFLQDNNNYNDIIKDCCEKIANIELECEMMVLEKIKNHRLNINLDQYARDANSYVCCYYLIPEFGRWMDDKPYSLAYLFPNTLNIDHRSWALFLKQHYKKIFFKENN